MVFVYRILPRTLSGHELLEGIALFNRIEPTPFKNDLAMSDFPHPVSPFETVNVAAAKGQILRRRPVFGFAPMHGEEIALAMGDVSLYLDELVAQEMGRAFIAAQ